MNSIETKDRSKDGNCVPMRVALVGAGMMAEVLLNQIIKYYPDIEVAVIINRNTERARTLYKQYGIRARKVATTQELDRNIEEGVASVTNNFHTVGESKYIQAFLEMTGNVEFGARAALIAIQYKKHFINFNSELDATVGPVLNYKARQAGVIYSGADGDQPGVTMNLYHYVTSLGMRPVVCGSNKGMLDHYRNPETQSCFAEEWEMSAQMATSFADGTKLSMEQCAIANATGMQVEQRGMRGETVDGHVDDYKSLYDVEKLKELGGVVDYLIGVSPKPGIFIYATTDDPVIKKQMEYLKMGKGPLYSFYSPYHLCALDVPNSIEKVLKEHKPVFAPKGKPYVEVVAVAKTSLKEGRRLKGLGGFTVYGLCENAEVSWAENLLPVGLAECAVLKRDIPKDQVITFEDVEFPKDSLVLMLYKDQRAFFSETAGQLPEAA